MRRRYCTRSRRRDVIPDKLVAPRGGGAAGVFGLAFWVRTRLRRAPERCVRGVLGAAFEDGRESWSIQGGEVHMQLRSFCVALMVLGLTAAALGREKGDARLPEDWRDEGFSLYAAAPTVKALAEKTRPTLVTDHEEPFFVWAEPHKGAFAFTVAEAKRLPSGEWCLLAGGDGTNTVMAYPRRRVTCAVEKPSTGSPSTYIAAPAKHRKHGTLYMLALARQEGCLQGETRIFMLRSPKGSWRYVGWGLGPNGECGYREQACGMSIEWTADEKAPLKVTLLRKSEGEEYPVRWTETVMSGTLPIRRCISHDYVMVGKGETLSAVVARLTGQSGKTGEALRQEQGRVRAALLRLNPAAGKGLKEGQRLLLPEESRETLGCAR